MYSPFKTRLSSSTIKSIRILIQSPKVYRPLVGLAIVGFVILLFPMRFSSAQTNAVPTPVSPADNAITTVENYEPLGIPEFTWAPVQGATSYRIQISQGDIGFSQNNIKLNATTVLTSYTPTSANIFADGDWYWRIRVDAPADMVSDYSFPYKFTKDWAGQQSGSTPNRPVLTAPGDGITLEFFNYEAGVFSWEHVVGAASYRFQIDTTQDFVLPLSYETTTIAPTHQPAAKLANGTYYWRVIPLDPANREGTPSEVRQFVLNYNQVPALLEPENNATPTFTPSFRWQAVPGAQTYRLQYSTDSSFQSNVTQVDTKNTTHTPVSTIPNDVNYYWRVRTLSGSSVSDWSEVRTFVKQWYLVPTLLTPTNLYQHQRFPLFSWTPVPAASKYEIEWATSSDFVGAESASTPNPYYTPQRYDGTEGTRYWRVTPFDGNGRSGKTTLAKSFESSQDFVAPHQVYPLYYYAPDSGLNPRVDRTVPLPIFMWQRVTTPFPIGGPYADAYRLQVSSDPLFNTVDWEFDTENLSAAPTATDPFTPTVDTDYYWRVCILYFIGSSCQTNFANGLPWWSQTWKTRIDLSKGLTATVGATSPMLLRPDHAAEFVEMTPLLEWWPLEGADAYQVQISTDENFVDTYTVITDTVPYPAYTPQTSLAQRSLGRTDYGSFYWRVRGLSGGIPAGDWSASRRFQIASQSEWLRNRTIGHPENALLIGSDPVGDQTDPNYDLTGLYASQSASHWYFGFEANAALTDTTYVLYLDIDQEDGSGATSDARAYNVSTIPAHRPEFAIYVDQIDGEFTPQNVSIWPWDQASSQWDTAELKLLSEIGGQMFSSDVDLRSVDMVSSANAWTVGDLGNILQWNGSQWTQESTPTANNLYAVDLVSSLDGFAVGQNGIILQWDGFDWSVSRSPNANEPALYATHVFSETFAWAVGASRKAVRWNGTNWSNVNTPAGIETLYATEMVSTTLGWAAGSFGTILEWNGTAWSEITSPTSSTLRDIAMFSDTDGWLVGFGGTILRWNGITWSTYVTTTPTVENLYGVDLFSASDGWAVGANGTILRWDGSTWSSFASPTTHHLYGVSMASSTSAVAVGEMGINLRWNGSEWLVEDSPLAYYMELEIPNSAIGMDEQTGSYSVSLFSLPTGGTTAQDSVPSDPNIPGSGPISRFASVSEHMNLTSPPNNVNGEDPNVFLFIPPHFWEYPTGSNPASPWAGVDLELHLDEAFTSLVNRFETRSDGAYYARTSGAWTLGFPNNTYFWRIKPRYYDGTVAFGSWSQGWRFELQGLKAKNLQTSVTFATPTFSWDRAEGANSYNLQVDNDATFTTPELNITTRQNTYTPNSTLANGLYYWRVRVIREGNVSADWSEVVTFTLELPQPANLRHYPSGVADRTPSLCWDTLLENDSEGTPVLAAYRYNIQISRDPTFSSVFQSTDTEQTCWTPTAGFEDGKYYWRVAMLDGQNRLGNYSDAVTFDKQYPTTTLISPLGSVESTPTFVWTPVDGAHSYRIEISKFENFSQLFATVVTNNTRFTPTSEYEGGTFYWRVAIIDRAGKQGPFNDAVIILDPTGLPNKTYLPLILR